MKIGEDLKMNGIAIVTLLLLGVFLLGVVAYTLLLHRKLRRLQRRYAKKYGECLELGREHEKLRVTRGILLDEASISRFIVPFLLHTPKEDDRSWTSLSEELYGSADDRSEILLEKLLQAHWELVHLNVMGDGLTLNSSPLTLRVKSGQGKLSGILVMIDYVGRPKAILKIWREKMIN